MTEVTFADALLAWAGSRREIEALVLIGSRARAADDAHSDWDFHVITSRPATFATRTWTRELSGFELRAYTAGTARVGGVPRVAAVFDRAEADVVVIPAMAARALRWGLKLGLTRRPGRVQRGMQDLAIVIRPGWRFLKPNPRWEALYRDAVQAVSDPRLADEAAIGLAEAFVCQWLSISRRIERGELHAAGRFLQRELVETNYRLLHELRQRRGQLSFPEARRLERIASAEELALVTAAGPLTRDSLKEQAARCRAALVKLMAELVGAKWRWPL